MTGARCRYRTKSTGGEYQHYGNTCSHKGHWEAPRSQAHQAKWEFGEKEAMGLWAGGWVGGLVRTKTGSWQNNGSGGVDAEVDKISSEKK